MSDNNNSEDGINTEVSLPTEAMAHFDEQANSLVSELKPVPPRKSNAPLSGSLGEKPIMGSFNADMVSNLQIDYRDGFGNLCGFEVHGDGIHECLVGDAAIQAKRLIEKVATRRELRSFCSIDYVENHLKNWIRNRRTGKMSDESWTANLISNLKKDIGDCTVRLPLEGIEISTPFELGQIRFDYFTKAWIDDYLSKFPPMDANKMAEFENKLRKQYQGRVYAEFRYRAEPKRVSQLATVHTERALDILRMFHFGAFMIDVQCFVGLMGQVTPGLQYEFAYTGTTFNRSEGKAEKPHLFLTMDTRTMAMMKSSGIWIGDELLRKSALTDLEQHALESISHFAHGVMSSAPQDRLIHSLVAVESLLLKDQNEPIQASLGYRMAMLTETNADNRIRAEKEVRDAYGLRSRFVHHGIASTDTSLANSILLRCWNTLNTAMRNTRQFETRMALINALDKAKYS